MQPTHHVTFEQAKLLKTIGFNELVRFYYRITGSGIFESSVVNHNDDQLRETAGGMTYVSAPEHWQVVEWLRVKHKIWVSCELDEDMYKSRVYSFRNGNKHIPMGFKNYVTPQEAYLAAFDFILANVLNK